MICPNIGHPNEGAISFTTFVYFQIQNDFILSFLTEFMTASKRKGGKTKISHRQSPRFLLVTSHNPPPNPQDNGLVMSCLVKDQKYLSYLLPFILLNASVRLIQSIFNNAFTQPILQTFFFFIKVDFLENCWQKYQVFLKRGPCKNTLGEVD